MDTIKNDNNKEDPCTDTTNVFVKFLPSSVNDLELHNMFSPFGRIVSAKVMLDPHSWRSLGYGFVKFSHEEDAQMAIKYMLGKQIENKFLLCKLSNNFVIAAPSCNLYIKPLPPFFTEEKLLEFFSKFGVVNTVKIISDQHRPNNNETFEEACSALNAIHETNGTQLVLGWPAITVKYAESGPQRAQRKANLSPLPKGKVVNHQGQFTTDATTPVQPSYETAGYPCDCSYCQPHPQRYSVYLPATPQGWYNIYQNRYYPCYISS